MRTILQRVTSAAVSVDGCEVSRIGPGILVLVGVERGDGEPEVERTAAKIAALRIFDDGEGRMNLAAPQVKAELLVVSQFTLAASLDRGRRPSFDRAAPAETAAPLVERLARRLEEIGLGVQRGVFGARMEVSLVNSGPVTFVLDA